jgi:hypothetical protein
LRATGSREGVPDDKLRRGHRARNASSRIRDSTNCKC